jgi:outer membrane biosynthesis protein TonB
MTISPFQPTPRSTLYRMARWRVIPGIFAIGIFLQAVLPPTVAAQGGRAKTSKEPRALGLLELAPNGKAHLIPITIRIDDKYYDASAYKAAPVPMALWSDTVYEAVRSGVSLGLFTVTGALQRKDENEAVEWIAEGTWQSASDIKAKPARKPLQSVPRGMNEDEGPPVLRRGGSEKPKEPESPAAPTTSTQTQPAPVSTPSTPPPSPPPASTSSSTAPPSQQQPPQEDKAPEDKDRPALKRGKAGAASAEEAQKKAVAASIKPAGHSRTSAPASAGTTSAASPGAQPANQIQLIPAISDSGGPDPLPYTYNLKPEDEQQFRKKMLAMAADEVRAYAGQLGSSAGTAKSVHDASPHGKATAGKPPQPTFEDVQLRVFDLSNINEPELVLTAKANMPLRSHEKETPNVQYMITLVVREDVNGELHKALANVTDTQHTGVIPQLELIDAVDADGDGRGELLFRQVSDAGSAFVVYRVIGDRLYPLFQGAPGR